MEPTNRSVRFFHQASKHVRTHGRENARGHEREKGVLQIGKCLRENCPLIVLSCIFCISFSYVFFFLLCISVCLSDNTRFKYTFCCTWSKFIYLFVSVREYVNTVCSAFWHGPMYLATTSETSTARLITTGAELSVTHAYIRSNRFDIRALVYGRVYKTWLHASYFC